MEYTGQVAINYTIYLGEQTWDEIQQFITVRHNDIIKELGYELCCNTYGIHRNAERLHIHYHTINNITKMKKFKNKGLASKIKRLKSYQEYTLPHKEFKIPEVKISTNYEDEINWDKTKILAYPLKEYDTNKSMIKEVNLDVCIGVTENQLEEYRKYANSLYERANKEFQKQEKKKTKKEDLYSHLDSVIVTTNIPDYSGEMASLMLYTIKQILLYYKINNKNFSIHQLKNQAVNYLYFKDIITEQQICQYINIA